MNLILSATDDWGIGFQNRLLFRVPEDMKRFKALTVGKVVVMGRNTFLSLPNQKPLADRVNIVLSRDPDFAPESVTVVRSTDELLCALESFGTNDVFVIGGAAVYRELLPFCDTAYVTRFHAKKEADSFFPCLDGDDSWRLVERSEVRGHEGLQFTFDKYERATAAR
ncbi:MAG: dihydrofolate reductase [Oscillospiraceae bacterium]|nr:dihydrofolate reductase [Oscillospiraceae bacterium]